jgi:hypothetical protein
VSSLGARSRQASATARITLKTIRVHGSITVPVGLRKFELCPMWGAINMNAEFSAFWWTAERHRSARNGLHFSKSPFSQPA